MLGLGSSLLQGGALRSIVRSGLQLFYKADRTQAPLGEEQVRNNSFDEISANLVSNSTFDLGSEAVQNGTFNLGNEVVQNRTFELGSEEVEDGHFPLPNVKWAVDNGTAITASGARVNNTATGGIAFVKQFLNNSPFGKTFVLTYDVVSTNGNLLVLQQASDLDLDTATIGTNKKFTFSWDRPIDELTIKRKGGQATGTDVTISNVSLKEVPNWEVDDENWSVANNKLNGTSAITENSQTIFASNSSRMLKITYDLVVDSGAVAVYMADKGKIFIYQSGSYTDYVTSEHTDIRIDGRDSSPFTGSVANVSVKEITNWELGSNWSVANNVATLASSDDQTTSLLTSDTSLVSSKTYILTYTISNYVSGELALVNGNVSIPSTNGNKTFTFTGQTELSIKRKGGATALSISNISVKEVPDWELQSNWSVSENQVVSNGSDGWVKQKNVVTNGESYQVVFSAEVSSGRFRAVTTADASTYTPYITESGTYTFYVSPTNSLAGGFEFVSDAFDGSITNVFVKQLDPNNRWTVNNDTPSEQTVEIREGSFFIEYDSTATKGTASINVNSAGIVNQKYEIKVVVDSINNDEKLKVQLGNSPHNLSVGTNIFEATSTTSGTLTLGRTHENDSVTATVSSVSLRAITNSIKDHSKNSNDGILYSGKALDFDGDGDIVELNDANLPGEFAVCTWVKPDTFTDCVVFGDGRDENNAYLNLNWIRLNSSTSITVKINGLSEGYAPITHGSNIAQDEWSRLIVTRDSDNIIRFGINGVFYSPSNQARAGNFNFNLLGRKQDTEMNGALADVQVYDKAWNATDVKYDWENPDKDVFDRVGVAEVLGEELVSDTDFTTGALWTEGSPAWSISNGKARVDTTNANTDLYQNIGTVQGGSYKISFKVSDYVSGSVQVTLGYGGSFVGSETVDDNGVYEVITTTNPTNPHFLYISTREATTKLSIDYITVKEVTTHASHILPTDCKSLLRLNEGAGDRVYDAAPVLRDEEVQNGTFELGTEEITDGDFPTGTTAWVKLIPSGQVVEFVNNQLHINYDASKAQGAAGVRQSILTPGKTYEISIDIQSITAPLTVLAGGVSNNFDTIGVKTFTVTPTTNALFIINPLGGGIYNDMECYINSISVKEVPNWTLINNTTIVDGVANIVAGGDVASTTDNWSLKSYNNVFQANKTYRIKFRAKQVSLASSNAGAFQLGYSYYPLFDQVITNEFVDYEVVKTSNSSSILNLTAGGRIAGDVFQIDDISVKEIKPAENFAIVGTKAFIHQQPYIPQYAMSSFSKKMFFDGVNDYVTGSFNGNIGPAKDMTFSCWFSYEDSVASAGDRETLFGLLSSSADGFPARKFEVGLIETNRIVVYTGDGTTATSSSTFSDTSSPLSNNKLNHVVVSLSSNGVVGIYVNGVKSATATHTNFGAPTITHYRIGSRNNTSLLNKGIIDEVSLFKSELTQDEVLELYNSGSSFDSTGHSKYNLGEEVSNGTFELGSEEVVNRDFATDSDWTEGVGWDIDVFNNKATCDGSQTANSDLEQAIVLTQGSSYQVKFDLIRTAGVLYPKVGDETGDGVSSSQSVTQTIIAGSTDKLLLRADVNFIGSVTNVSVKEIPSWSSSTFPSATMSVNTSGQLELASSPSEYLGAYTPISLVEGRTYVLSVDIISSDTYGQIRIGTSSSVSNWAGPYDILDAAGSGVPIGTNTYTFTATSDQASKSFLYIGGRNDVNSLVIDNVSLQEYGVSGYWRNNGADQWDDLSINSNHGTVSGSPTEIFLQEVPFFGKDSLGMFMNKPRLGGLNLNGSGYVEIEDTADLDFPAATGVDNVGEFSVECWVRYKFLSQGSTVNCIYSNGEEVNDVNTFSLITNQDNKIGFYVNGTLCSSSSTFSLDEWVHVAGTREHGTNGVKLYINGNTTPEATTTNNNTVTNSFNKRIGWDSHADRYLESVVDDVKLYDRALTPAEIKKNYNATKSKHKN